MRMKRIISLALVCVMIISLLPTVALAAEGEYVYDFSTYAFSDYADKATSLKTTNVNNYTLDRTVSTGYWRYESQFNEKTVGFQKDGLCFYTPVKETTKDSNAVVLTITVDKDGAYTPSVTHTEITYGEKTDIYIVKKDVVTANGWSVTDISGIQTMIGASSMINPDADVKHLASYETNPNTTGEDAYAEKVNLTAGDYYMFVIANEGNPQYNADRTYGMLTTLKLSPYVAPARIESPKYSFTLGAIKGASGSSIKVNTVTNKSMLDSTVSTGAWQYYTKPGIQYEGVYAAGLQYYAFTENEGKNAMVLKIWLDESGTYVPQLAYTQAGYCSFIDAYLVSAEKATAEGWNMAEIDTINTVIADSESSEHIASVNTHTSGAVSPYVGEAAALSAGEYYLVFTNSIPDGVTYSDRRMYGYIESLTLLRQYPLTAIEVSDIKTTVGEVISADVTWKSGEQELDGSLGVISYEVISNDDGVLFCDAAGKICATAEGSARIKVTGTLSGKSASAEVDVTVGAPEPLSGADAVYGFYNGASEDFQATGLVVTNPDGTPVKNGHTLTERELEGYAYREYGEGRPWAMVATNASRPDSTGAYFKGNASYIDLSCKAGEWIAYKVKVPKAGKYFVDVAAYRYGNGGAAEVYMLPYEESMTFSDINANIGTYASEENLVADADFNGLPATVVNRAFSGEFRAAESADFAANGYDEYLMIVKTCESKVAAGKYYLLMRSIAIRGSERDISVETKLSEDVAGVGESVFVTSVEGKDENGNGVDLSSAVIFYAVAEGDEDVLEFDVNTSSVRGLKEGKGTLLTLVVMGGRIYRGETEITIDDSFAIKAGYLYPGGAIDAGDIFSFTTGFELENRKVISGGKIESLEIVSQSENGVAVLESNNTVLRGMKGGTVQVRAKISFRGNVYTSDTVTLRVYGKDSAMSASGFMIDLRAGAYVGDTYTNVNDIKTYTEYRNWIFHGFNNPDPSYPTIALATGKLNYAQIVWKKGDSFPNSYIAFEVDFPSESIYKADAFISLRRKVSPGLECYIVPKTDETSANLLSYLVKDNEYYVGAEDLWASPDDSAGCEVSFGSKSVAKGKHYVVYKAYKGAAGDSSWAAYPLYFTFTNESALGEATLSLSDGATSVPLGGVVGTKLTITTVGGSEIAPEDAESIVYSTSNSSVATVDEQGIITGVSEGQAKIYAAVSRGGITKTATLNVSVEDASGIAKIEISMPDSVYIYGRVQPKLFATMVSGNVLEIPSEYVTWSFAEGTDSSAAQWLETGAVYGLKTGEVYIVAEIDSSYRNGVANGIEIAPKKLAVTWDSTIDPQIYTKQSRENAIKNAERYSWARSEVRSAETEAETYLPYVDTLYNLIAPEGLPRWYHIGHTADPLKFHCRYCGENISLNFGSYGWGVNALGNPWKVQCPACKRRFPSNDFGSFYKLGLSESGSWSYEKALSEHHKKFVCADGEQCTCQNAPHPTEARMSPEWIEYYGFGKGYLANSDYPEMDEKLGVVGWGVDDSLGYMQPYISPERAAEIAGPGGDITKVPGYDHRYYEGEYGLARFRDGTKEGPVQHPYISYFLHEGVWYGQGNVPGGAVIRKAINAFANAFVYTGDPKYGRAGAILLDRIADVYPDFDWFRWHTWRGDSYYGTIVDPVWSTFIATEYAKAYDAFLPIYNDEYVVDYLSTHGARYETDENGDWLRDESGSLIVGENSNLKENPGALRKNVEENILLEIFEGVKYGKIWGNFGMHQQSIVTAAVALNRLPETVEMIDWIMADGPEPATSGISTGTAPRTDPVTGGAFMKVLVGMVDRDGSGTEAAAGYNSLWIQNFLGVAERLRDYELYPSGNLFENPKFLKMFPAQIRLTLGGYYTIQAGDSGALGSTGFAVYTEDQIKGYQETRDPEIAKALWLMKETYGDELRGSILDDDPEQITREIEQIIEDEGKLNLGSDMLTGFGFAALRAGGKYDSASVSSEKNSSRDLALYFGRSDMHGHVDALNLYMSAFGLNLAPDIGYPETTGTAPNRYEWVRTTISHNTVVVDEEEQVAVSGAHTPYHFDDSGRVKLMDIDATKAYPDTDEYRRTVFMIDADDDISYGVDFFHVKGGSDHLYSFHSQSEEIYDVSGLSDLQVQETYVNKAGETIGTYAGADVKFGADPGGVFSGVYPRGYTWLKNIRTYKGIEKDFSVEFKVCDWKRVLDTSKDIRLRLTMVGDEPVNEVTFATAVPPQTKSNLGVGEFEYLLVRKKGTNLDTTFTTVLEPYENGKKYIKSIEKVSMVRDPSSKPSVNDAYGAVKVTLENGRTDYVIYSNNSTVDYLVDNKIKFRGFGGVMSLELVGGQEKVVYSYLNDGEVLCLKDETPEIAEAVYTGRVKSFTRDLADENFIVYTPDEGQTVNTDDLAGKYVYIENDGVQNGAYRIESAEEVDGKIELNIGDVTTIRKYIDPKDMERGYVYNIAEGQTLRIPLTSIYDSTPTFDEIEDKTVSAGSSITIPLTASSKVGKDITFVGTSLPRGMTIDHTAKALVWKPDNSQTGDNHVAITASDGTLEATRHFTVTVYGSTTSKPSQDDSTGSTDSTDTPSGGGGGGGGGAAPAPDTGDDTDVPSDNTGDTENDNPDSSEQGDESGDNVENNLRFTDLESHAWAEDAIVELSEKGIIKGTSDSTYSPKNNITRADFAILLVRAFELSSDNTENFADVEESDYFATELAIARNCGIVGGIGDNRYAPRSTITRQDMMVIVYRALTALEITVGDGSPDVLKHPDFDHVAPYAKDAVAALVSAGLINGKNGLIDPTAYTTRAEVAVLIKRILDYVK